MGAVGPTLADARRRVEQSCSEQPRKERFVPIRIEVAAHDEWPRQVREPVCELRKESRPIPDALEWKVNDDASNVCRPEVELDVERPRVTVRRRDDGKRGACGDRALADDCQTARVVVLEACEAEVGGDLGGRTRATLFTDRFLKRDDVRFRLA